MGASDDIIAEVFLIILGIIVILIALAVSLYAGNEIGNDLKGIFNTIMEKIFLIHYIS